MKTALLRHRTRLPRHRPMAATVMAMSAVLAGVALASCGTAKQATPSLNPRNPQTQAPSHTAEPAPSATPSQPPLGAGQVGTLAQVPWGQTGPGWALAQYFTGRSETGSELAAPVTLCMIDPEGGMYQIYQWPATKYPWYLIDWSGDKTRVLLEDLQTSTTTLHELTLATGQITTLTLPVGNSQVVGYTRPDGKNILAAQHGIVRYNLNGVPQARLTGANGIVDSAVSSADGRTEVVNSGSGLELVSNAGGVIRRLPIPGVAAYTCDPIRWWNSSDVLVSCSPGGMVGGQLWIVPVSGATPTVLTPARGFNGPDYSDIDAWQLPTALYLQAVGSCAGYIIGKQAADGTVQEISVPGISGGNLVVATSGSQMLVRGFGSCQPAVAAGSALVWFNPATGTAQHVLTPPPGSDGVVSAIPFNADGKQPFFVIGNWPR